MNVNGKLVKEHSESVNATYLESDYTPYETKGFKGRLLNSIKIKNIPKKGFCVTYAVSEFINGTKIKNPDDLINSNSKQNIQVFDYKGELLWRNLLPDSKVLFTIPLASSSNIYILRKNYLKEKFSEYHGGYDLLSLKSADGTIQKHEKITDNKGNAFQVLNFSNEIDLNTPIVSGLIMEDNTVYFNQSAVARGENMGVFSIVAKDSIFKTQTSYWSDGKYKPEISKRGYLKQTKSYLGINCSFSDAEGNIYFAGSGLTRKTRWGSIIAATLTIPLVFPPAFILVMGGGLNKYKFENTVILKQDPKGVLSYYNSQESNVNFNKWLFSYQKSYFTVNQGKFLVLNDDEDIFIYNIKDKSLAKRIPHKDGNTKTEVYKAKEGHIMILEYNSNEKSTKLSIESL